MWTIENQTRKSPDVFGNREFRFSMDTVILKNPVMSCTLEYNYFFTYMVEKIYLRDKNQATNFWDYVKRHKPPLCVGLDQGWPHFL